MNVFPITNLEYIEANWSEIAEVLLPCFDELCTEQDTIERLLSGEWLLWSVLNNGEVTAYAISSFIYYPNTTHFRVLLCAGAFVDWSETLKNIEPFVKANGIDVIEVQGRKGWQRVLTDYELSHITIRKQL